MPLKNDNTAVTEKADKGNSIVILYKPHCHETVNDFIKSYDCAILNKDPNNSCQKDIRHFPNANTNLLSKQCKWKFINIRLIPPTLSGLMKIHATDSSIRPVVELAKCPRPQTS